MNQFLNLKVWGIVVIFYSLIGLFVYLFVNQLGYGVWLFSLPATWLILIAQLSGFLISDLSGYTPYGTFIFCLCLGSVISLILTYSIFHKIFQKSA